MKIGVANIIKNRIFSAEILDSGNIIITKKQTIAAKVIFPLVVGENLSLNSKVREIPANTRGVK